MGIIVSATLLIALGALVFVAIVWASQRQLLYFPSPRVVESASSAIPGAVDVTLETDDGLRLGAYFVPARRLTDGATVLLCNGNAGDRLARASFARAMSDAGCGVLVFDYRGYGGNAGSPSEDGLARDARAALRYLESRGDVDRARLVYFGESLGSAVCARLAGERPPAALVLRSPFTTLAEVGGIHYPYLPVFDALLFDRYRTLDAVRGLRAPLLVIAGANDQTIPPDLSRALYDAAPEPKRFVLIPDADHNDLELFEGSVLMASFTAFVRERVR